VVLSVTPEGGSLRDRYHRGGGGPRAADAGPKGKGGHP
jgi:hypothetical protein